jgi:hypothetical protein
MPRYDATGQGKELERKLQALSTTDLKAEYKYRLRERPTGGAWLATAEGRAWMISRIVSYVDKTGDGPERLKDMLRF